MISDVNELKQFIIWAKSQQIKSLTISGISFEFSEIAHIQGLPDMSEPAKSKDLSVPPSSPRLPDGNAQLSEDEEALFWSARS